MKRGGQFTPAEGGQFKSAQTGQFIRRMHQQHKNLTQPVTFFHRFSDNLLLSGHLLKGTLTTPTLFSAIEGHGFDEENDPNYYKSVRSRIKSKLYKYKNLTTQGFPLLLVIYNNNQWLDTNDFDQILFGDIDYIIDANTGKTTGYVRRDGIIRNSMNTTLSAIILKNDQLGQGYHLIKNPFARIPIDSIEDEIRKAFKI